jgi:hypothetical protein
MTWTEAAGPCLATRSADFATEAMRKVSAV